MTQQDSFGPGHPGPLPPPPPGYPAGHYRQDAEVSYAPPAYDAPAYDAPWAESQTYGAPSYGNPGYDPTGYQYQAPYGQPAYPGASEYGYPAPPPKTNVMAILGLVFAFLFSPLGVVFSAIGLSQTRRRGEKGRGLALTGLVVAIVALVIEVLVVVLAVAAAQRQLDTTAAAAQSPDSGITAAPAGPSEGTGDAGTTPGLTGGDPQGVLGACKVILPALMDLETDLANVSTPEEYSQALARLEKTMGDAAAGTSDAGFVQDVARLDADLQRAAASVQAGQDPAGLANALQSDGMAVGTDCGTAGFTQ